MEVMRAGLLGYAEGLALQRRIHAERLGGERADTLILLEHNPVYTLGKNALAGNILADRDWLDQRGIEVFETDRGGDVTYHGPGQLVGYPVFNLAELGIGVRKYVNLLEEVLIKVLDSFGIKSGRDTDHPGVWVGKNKIAALGIRVKKNVSMHGFALNVAPEMEHYRGILACGIAERGITGMVQEKGNKDITIEAVSDVVVEMMEGMFCKKYSYWRG